MTHSVINECSNADIIEYVYKSYINDSDDLQFEVFDLFDSDELNNIFKQLCLYVAQHTKFNNKSCLEYQYQNVIDDLADYFGFDAEGVITTDEISDYVALIAPRVG